ncbi:MAG: hypothetical protein ABIO78_00680, partial [Thermoanaerobaculia bacterium]
KWTFASSTEVGYREPLVSGDVLYVGTETEIKRFDLMGTELSRLSPLNNTIFLTAGVDGRVISSNISGEIVAFNADGTVRRRLDIFSVPTAPARGIDLDADQCTVHYASDNRLARWNSCTGERPVVFPQAWARPPGFGHALRRIDGGRFLVTYLSDIALLDGSGAVIRTYGIPGQPLALDLNGRSFWTGVSGTLVKVSIETGQIEQLVHTGQAVLWLSVVGEPRAALGGSAAAIPTLSAVGFFCVIAGLGLVALVRLR